jgi:hypothetical protein
MITTVVVAYCFSIVEGLCWKEPTLFCCRLIWFRPTSPFSYTQTRGQGEWSQIKHRKKDGPLLLYLIPFFPADHEIWVVAYRGLMAIGNKHTI